MIRSLVLTLLIVTACTAQEAVTNPTATITPSPVPTLQPSPLPTLQPSITPEPPPTATPIQINPLIGEPQAPPIEIQLPDDWQFGYDTLLIDDMGDLRPVPFALYTGPVSGGQGFIVLLWGFPSITSGIPTGDDFGVANVALDGSRLLRQAIVENGCNVGTDFERDYAYNVGELAASGTQFAAVDCPDGLPDTRGWFAGVQQEGMNFVFYMYTEPITAMDGSAPDEMQAILDTVTFDVAAFLEAQRGTDNE